MKRRDVVGGLVAAASMPAGSLFAQSPQKSARIGVLITGASPHPLAEALPRELAELGYSDGRNISFEFRFGDGQRERIAQGAAELVRSGVDIIVTIQTPAGRAARDATTSIPIVLAGVGAPLETGLVSSLSRPGGNITGLTDLAAELGGRRLQVLKEIIPGLARVGALTSPHDLFTRPFIGYMEEVAPSIGIALTPAPVEGLAQFDEAFAALVRVGVQAVVVQGIFNPHRSALLAIAAKHRLPLVSWDADMTRMGGLFSLSSNRADQYRRTAVFIDKILKGARPGDLPVEQPTSFEFVVNLRTARAFGFTVPSAILFAADEVID